MNHESGRKELQLPAGFIPTWGGPCPVNNGMCFGSEDGRLLITDIEGNPISPPFASPISLSGPINGVAFSGDFIATSTPGEVVFRTLPANGSGIIAQFEGGAHGVVATRSGKFVAPLGTNGLMVHTPSVGKTQEGCVFAFKNRPLNLYRAIPVASGESEILVCAARTNGVAAFRTASRVFSYFHAPNLDIVDVCALAQGPRQSKVAAVARDRTLILFQDVERDEKPITLRFDFMRGTAFSLFQAHGHLILLTGKAIYFVRDLAKQFLEGVPVDRQPASGWEIPIEAVDADIVGGRWLLVLTTAAPIRFDLDLLARAETLRDLEMSPTSTPSEGHRGHEAAEFSKAA